MELFYNQAKLKIKNFATTNLQKINVLPGTCRYNFRCHNNAVHDAINEQQNEIAMCIYIDNNYPVIHFLNIDKDGNYIDNTLGNWAVTYQYYLVKHISKSDFFNIITIFKAYRIDLRKKLPLYIRLFSNIQF